MKKKNNPKKDNSFVLPFLLSIKGFALKLCVAFDYFGNRLLE